MSTIIRTMSWGLALMLVLGLAGCAGKQQIAAGPILPSNPADPFKVSLTTPQPQPLVEGEGMQFVLLSALDGYAHLYNLRQSGDVQVLAENLPLAARVPRSYPSIQDGFELRAQAPAGRDQIVLVVTRSPFNAGVLPPGRRPPAAAVQTPEQVATRLRSILERQPVDGWSRDILAVDVLVRR